jgi:hypothetical protein
MAKEKESIVGLKYGKLEIIEELASEIDNSGCSRRVVLVKCDCGNTTTKKLKYLKSGETITCSSCITPAVGKTRYGKDVLKTFPREDEHDLVGKKFGRFTVTSVGYVSGRTRVLDVSCDCGNKAFINKACVLSGRSTSCGCYSKELGHTLNKSHGLSSSETYISWSAIIQRCQNVNNPSYTDYGGRGIGVCDDWLNFENFLIDMGERPPNKSIERLDVNKGYCKENCVWADNFEQSINRRKFKSNTSGKTGVVLNKRTGNWVASISYKGNKIHLGTFTDFELACIVREEAELRYYGFNKE